MQRNTASAMRRAGSAASATAGILMTALERYYAKFDESHRLCTRHGQVEFRVSMKYIHDFIAPGRQLKILDPSRGKAMP